MKEVVIVDAVRTPMGKSKMAYSEMFGQKIYLLISLKH